jgi:hypothetical protein
MTPGVYFSFRRSYEKTCALAVGFQRVLGSVTEEGEDENSISESAVSMAAGISWVVIT